MIPAENHTWPECPKASNNNENQQSFYNDMKASMHQKTPRDEEPRAKQRVACVLEPNIQTKRQADPTGEMAFSEEDLFYD